jgi:MFS transporter, AAHS family, 3-hydroxyphenylpropionic acid transporter
MHINKPETNDLRSWSRVVVLWLCGVFAAMQFSKIAFVFQDLQTTYAITPAQTGLLLSMVGMVGLVFGVTVGLFAPAIGYRRLLLTGLGLGAALAFLQAQMPPHPLFLLTRILEGASHLAVVVAAPTLISMNCPPGHRSLAMGTFVGVAFALTAAAGSWVVARFQVSGLLLGHALAMTFMFATALFVMQGDTETPRQRQWPRLTSLPRHHLTTYSQWVTALPGACFFFYTVMAISLLAFLPPLGGQHKAWLAIVLPLVNISGTFSAGWLAQYAAASTLLVRIAFASVGLGGMGLWLCFWWGTGMAPAAVVLVYLVGMAGGSVLALIPNLSNDPSTQARSNGAIAQMGNLGSTLGPPLFAYLIATAGTAGLAVAVILFALAGTGLAAWGIHRLSRSGHHGRTGSARGS